MAYGTEDHLLLSTKKIEKSKVHTKMESPINL